MLHLFKQLVSDDITEKPGDSQEEGMDETLVC